MVTILVEPAGTGTDPDFPTVIELPAGLIGFPELTHFGVKRADESASLLWLRPAQGGEDRATGFLMIDPSCWVEGYRLEISDEDAEWLALTGGSSPRVFNIVTLHPDDPDRSTVNLLGPLVVRREDGVGKQVILANHQRYSTAQPLVRGQLD